MSKAVKFIKEVRLELSKVVWPTRAETIRLTILVIFASLLIGLYVGGLDILFVRIVDSLLR